VIQVPAFPAHLSVVPGPEGVVVRSPRGAVLLEGPLYQRVLACVDGRRRAEEIVAMLADLPPEQVWYALLELERRGYLTESSGLPPGQAAWWSLQGVEPRAAVRRLARLGRVALRGLDCAPPPGLLEACGLDPADPAEAALVLVVTEDYLHPELEALNRQALACGRPWILAGACGGEAWLGPLLVPGRTGCWRCLARRLEANRPLEALLRGQAQKTRLPAAAPALEMAWRAAAHEACRWLGAGASALEGCLITLDTLAWTLARHPLARLPFCPACGGPPPEPSPPRLGPRPVACRQGGLRQRRAEETVEQLQVHLSPLTGAVRQLVRVTPARDPLHVYLAAHHRPSGPTSLDRLRRGLRNMSAGKGASDEQARAGALAEALERYSAIFQGHEPRRRATLAELGDSGLHPNDCMGYSERQFAHRREWNERGYIYNWIPEPFQAHRPAHWSPVWSLTRGEWRFLPTQYCYFGFADPDQPAAAMACTNGTAAGTCLEEALLQALLELVERDAVALWWYNRLARPGLDLAACSDPYPARVAGRLAEMGRDMWVLDLTSDLGIPVFAALSRCREGPERILLGAGAHLDPEIALQRAVSELAQMTARLDPSHLDGELWEWLQQGTLAGHPYLLPAGTRSLEGFPPAPGDDVLEALRHCQTLLERQGLEVLALDLTRPEIGLAVVKAFVPGLRHFWARFGPGRLYQVPVRLGWLPRALTEEELNPQPMFL
jgi:ribosomal protein S12 methylthiotransferase accessory factor